MNTPPEPPPRLDEADRLLPFSTWLPVLAGALAGVLLRILFTGAVGGRYDPMLASFIYVAPVLVGAVTVYVAERIERRHFLYYLWAPFVATCLFVLGTLLILIEGLICAMVIVPLFALLGVVGGIVMGVICRVTGWPRPTLYSLWALPLLLGAFEWQLDVPQRVRMVEHSIAIAAPPERVWREIHAAKHILPWEVDSAWLFRIGVPLPHEGVSREANGERVRVISMGKAVRFEQVVTAWDEHRLVRWRHRYQPDSFPPGALDDHVRLGGRYFDITSTEYELRAVKNGTVLHLRMEYRVRTSFNWYADRAATLLLNNFEGVLLDFYRRRAED